EPQPPLAWQGLFDRRPRVSGGRGGRRGPRRHRHLAAVRRAGGAPATRAGRARGGPASRPPAPPPDGVRPRDRGRGDGRAGGQGPEAPLDRGDGSPEEGQPVIAILSAFFCYGAFLLFESFALALDRLSPIKIRGLLEEHPERARLLSGAGE